MEEEKHGGKVCVAARTLRHWDDGNHQTGQGEAVGRNAKTGYQDDDDVKLMVDRLAYVP